MPEDTKKKIDIRREVAEQIAWASFHADQLMLGLLIEDHYARSRHLSFEEREAICWAWQKLEEGRDEDVEWD